MTKKITLLVIVFMFTAGLAMAAGLHYGDKFPNIALTGKLDSKQKDYLGLNGEGPWNLQDIKADYVLLEIYSMYCPHCQKEAPAVNDLYKLMLKSKKYNRLKLIGVGAGNSEFEIDFFKEKYGVEFPLFADADLIVHENTGSTGTPHFYLIKIDGSSSETLMSHEGPFKNPEDFLEEVSKAAGL